MNRLTVTSLRFRAVLPKARLRIQGSKKKTKSPALRATIHRPRRNSRHNGAAEPTRNLYERINSKFTVSIDSLPGQCARGAPVWSSLPAKTVVTLARRPPPPVSVPPLPLHCLSAFSNEGSTDADTPKQNFLSRYSFYHRKYD